MRAFILIDIGTGSTRIAMITDRGKLLDMRAVMNRYYRDEAYADSQYFLPGEWEKEILSAIDSLTIANPAADIFAISAAGTRQTIVLLDENGEAFLGLPNIDNRARDYMDKILPHSAELYRLTGKWATEDFPAAKLMATRIVQPDIYQKVSKFVSVSEWIGQIFTGKAVIEPSQACETDLYDINKADWSPELCELFGVDTELLPKIAPAGSSLGRVGMKHVRAFRLDASCVYLVGGADTQVALKSEPLAPGGIAVVSGTTSPVVTPANAPLNDSEQRVWTDMNLGGKGYLIEMNPGVTGLNYQRLKEALLPKVTYNELERDFAKKKRFYFTASFSSLLFHERRALKGGGLFTALPVDEYTGPEDMLWAALADTACSIYEQLWRLIEITGCKAKTIQGYGGGFQSAALGNMLSELSGCEIVLKPGFEQATLRGLQNICESKLGGFWMPQNEEDTIYRPGECELIKEYYPAWLENRRRISG